MLLFCSVNQGGIHDLASCRVVIFTVCHDHGYASYGHGRANPGRLGAGGAADFLQLEPRWSNLALRLKSGAPSGRSVQKTAGNAGYWRG